MTKPFRLMLLMLLVFQIHNFSIPLYGMSLLVFLLSLVSSATASRQVQSESQITGLPTVSPSSSMEPSPLITLIPSTETSLEPAALPSPFPSDTDSLEPSVLVVSQLPSEVWSAFPTSDASSIQLSSLPTLEPSTYGDPPPTTSMLTEESHVPSSLPSSVPSLLPSTLLSNLPSTTPVPISLKSLSPTNQWSELPSNEPSGKESFVSSSFVPSFQASQSSLDQSELNSLIPSTLRSVEPSLPAGKQSQLGSSVPSGLLSFEPSELQSLVPSGEPSHVRSLDPSYEPRVLSTEAPSVLPTKAPSVLPTEAPSIVPSLNPSSTPSLDSSNLPSGLPSSVPSLAPSSFPSLMPSVDPSNLPTLRPTEVNTSVPSRSPSAIPSHIPSFDPSDNPSSIPTGMPSMEPTLIPSPLPTNFPSEIPSSLPTLVPSVDPSNLPTLRPTEVKTFLPSRSPSVLPSHIPSFHPSGNPSSMPTGMPSIEPTLIPSPLSTNFPSEIPSSLPSDVPSDIPSFAPTMSPSQVPSLEPSNAPSRIPSLAPSTNPTNSPSSFPSMASSTAPSHDPTQRPSSEPSIEPTSLPSLQPSGSPSLFPSDQPSFGPSSTPSATPSDQPTAKPSLQPTNAPSSLPSTEPSFSATSSPSSQPSVRPSLSPSAKPSPLPTTSPSSTPSSQPSSTPSSQPSQSPSAFPSKSPSSMPSLTPSTQPTSSPSSGLSLFPSTRPSTTPSISPTPECHDSAFYQSPLNENLECADHIGTDCTSWQNLGLNSWQIVDLLNSCPETCNITCGSVEKIDLNLTITISNVEALLGPNSIGAFEDSTTTYLRDVLSSESEGISFALDPVQIISQEEIQEDSRLLLRALQEQRNLSIRIVFALQGATVDIENAVVQDIVLAGIGSSGYSTALQESGDTALANAVIAREPVIAASTGEVADASSSSTGALAGSIVSAVFIVGAIVGLMVYQRKSRNRVFLQENNAVFENFPQNPMALTRTPTNSGSFDVADNYASKVVRVVASAQTQTNVAQREPQPPTNRSETTSVSSDSEQGEPHPYLGVVPPMIVIENIESDASEAGRSRKMSHIVPGMQLRADSELLSALNDTTRPFDASLLSDFISKKVVDSAPQQQEIEDIPLARGESFNVFSSDADEASSTVEADTEVEEIVEALKESIEDGQTGMDSRAITNSRFGTPSGNPRPRRSWHRASRPRRAPSDTSNSQRGSPRSNSGSPSMINRDPTGSPSIHSREMMIDSPQQQYSMDMAMPPAQQHPYRETTLRRTVSSPTILNHPPAEEPDAIAPTTTTTRSTGILDSLWNRVLQKKSITDSSDGENSRSASRNSRTSRVTPGVQSNQVSSRARTANSGSQAPVVRGQGGSNTQARTGNSQATACIHRSNSHGSAHLAPNVSSTPQAPTHVRSSSQGSIHARTNSRASSSSGGVPSFNEEGNLETFEAPAKGKLGLVLEHLPFKGVVITRVKDYSPLLGQILPGDRMVNVNGTRTDHLSLGDVMKLMSNTSKTRNGMIRITVLRQYEDNAVDPLHDPRFHHSFEQQMRGFRPHFHHHHHTQQQQQQ